MLGPLIAIAGSANPARQYDPAVAPSVAKEIARQIGRELAKQGCRIVVYHSGDSYIESDVVAGFVLGKPSVDKVIVVRHPQQGGVEPFAEETKQPNLFDRRVDNSDDWEVAFYRSLADADGVLLIGGGSSTLIAGQVAIGSRIPLIAIASSGGSAAKVWKTLSAGEDLPTRDEQILMGRPWTDGSAAACVKSLLDQRRRRYAVESGPTVKHSLIAAVLFVASILVALRSAPADPRIWQLYLSTLLGGGAGASIRTVFERRYGTSPLVTPSVVVTLALGMIAGGLAGMLYLGAQPGTIDLTRDGAVRLVSFVAIVSFLGGLTAEAVYRKLLGLDVLHSRMLVADASTSKLS
jgi:hypothetical protein